MENNNLIELKNLLTEEQILEFTLCSLASKDYNIDGIEGEILTCYVMRKNPDASSEELRDGVSEIIGQFILKKLYLKNLITIDFDAEVPFSPSLEVEKVYERKTKNQKG